MNSFPIILLIGALIYAYSVIMFLMTIEFYDKIEIEHTKWYKILLICFPAGVVIMWRVGKKWLESNQDIQCIKILQAWLRR